MSDNNDIFNKLRDKLKSQFQKAYKDSDTVFQKASEEKPPTGLIVDNPLLEFVLDRRFMAYGRFYLIYGEKGSCKTSLFYDLCKLVQRNKGKVIWLETENAIDLDYAKKQGVDLDDVLLVHPQTLEEALNIAERTIRLLKDEDPEGDMPVLICLDSIAGSVTEYEQDATNDMTNTVPGAHARLLSRFYREMEHPLANEHCIFLALNQQKSKIGGFGFSAESKISLMGGEAPRFSSTYQWSMDKLGELKQKNKNNKAERKYGSKHEIKCIRNKLGREGPSQKVEFDLYIDGGIDWYSPLVRKLGEEYGDLVDYSSATKTRWKIADVHYIKADGTDGIIPTGTDKDDSETYGVMHERQLAQMIASSTQAKEIIRTAFGIPPLPAEEVVQEVEKERKAKRNKKKAQEAEKEKEL